ncbi:MAG: hypothetical protein R2744_05385 [Bacteroidales bacterium]
MHQKNYFGIQDDLNTRDMLLMLDYGVFYEFMTLDQLDKDNPVTYTVGEVEKRFNYISLFQQTEDYGGI